ncbi:MAG: hypothetical protein HY290_29565 [Planctomycetia bacterium]|nr:hypothetical protein [Planctomycetia bacterium]
MSLKLAETWVTASFRGLRSTLDALKLFEKASADGVDATLIAAPELMNNGKCCLAHWTGQELVVLELSPEQQRAFGIEPETMVQELALEQQPRELPPIRRVNLTDVRIDDHLHQDAQKPLTGVYTFEMNEAPAGPVLRCALRVKYFHPRMMCRITGYSHGNLVPPRGELPLSFDPLASALNPDPPRGPLVLFFQVVAGQSWTVQSTWRRISNVLVRVVEVV